MTEKEMKKQERVNAETVLQQELSEAQTEVEALVTSVGRGTIKWLFVLLIVLVASMATYYLIQSFYATLIVVLSLIGLFKSTTGA